MPGFRRAKTSLRLSRNPRDGCQLAIDCRVCVFLVDSDADAWQWRGLDEADQEAVLQ